MPDLLGRCRRPRSQPATLRPTTSTLRSANPQAAAAGCNGMNCNRKITMICLGALCAAFAPAQLRVQVLSVSQALRGPITEGSGYQRDKVSRNAHRRRADRRGRRTDELHVPLDERWRYAACHHPRGDHLRMCSSVLRPAARIPDGKGTVTVSYHLRRHLGNGTCPYSRQCHFRPYASIGLCLPQADVSMR